MAGRSWWRLPGLLLGLLLGATARQEVAQAVRGLVQARVDLNRLGQEQARLLKAALLVEGTPAHVLETAEAYLQRYNGLIADSVRLVQVLEEALSDASAVRRATFQGIYEEKLWQDGGNGPLSGSGSAADQGTKRLAEFILREAVSVLDVGCGDLTWLSALTTLCSGGAGGPQYIGVDIVPALISQHKENVAFRDGSCRFEVRDAVAEPLPRADLVLVKDVLFHVGLQQGVALLRNVVQSSECRLLLATTSKDPQVLNQEAMDRFHAHAINLRAEPFSLPAPMTALPHTRTDEVAVFSCAALREHFEISVPS